MASDIVSILLAGWSDSEFAVAASGEFGEDLKAKIEGELARKADRIEALEAENADLKRRLGNICMSIHTCAGDECERPICIANRKNKSLEAALRETMSRCTNCGGRGSFVKHDEVTDRDLWESCASCAVGYAALEEQNP